jgi:large subunit ribosomal protein L30
MSRALGSCLPLARRLITQSQTLTIRLASTSASGSLPPSTSSPSGSSSAESESPRSSDGTTHYRIILRRSAIGLPDYASRTLKALGIHRRMQTVYHRHSPETAGKILRVKELVEVQNVRPEEVRTKAEAKKERKPPRGYSVIRAKDAPWSIVEGPP